MAAKKKAKKKWRTKLAKRPARTIKGRRLLKKAMSPKDKALARAAEKHGLKWSIAHDDHPLGVRYGGIEIKLPAASRVLGIELKQYRSKKGDMAIIHRSTVPKVVKKGLPWQLSFYDDYGPIGHREKKTLKQAFDDATREGYAITQLLYKGKKR